MPLTRVALQDWDENVNDNFAVVPGGFILSLQQFDHDNSCLLDGNWYAIRPLYIHNVEELANKFTLEHLKTYNMEAGVPVAPEGRDSSYALFGDKYSNFNAGKILLILEGIGGSSFYFPG